MEEGDDQTLAYVSLVTALVGFFFMPFTMSVIAAITGRIQLKRIEEDPEIYGGKTLATIGFWLGVIRGSIYLIAMVFVIVMIFLMFGSVFAILGTIL